MTLNELPDIYQKLAIKRIREQNTDPFSEPSNKLIDLFTWSETPEGVNFWDECYEAEGVFALPLIPKTSLLEVVGRFGHLKIKQKV